MSTRRLWWSVGIGALIAILGVWPAAAQLPTYGVGRPPSAEEVKAWDLTIPFDGQGFFQLLLPAIDDARSIKSASIKVPLLMGDDLDASRRQVSLDVRNTAVPGTRVGGEASML